MERKLVEVDAFIHPVEDLPLLLARMRRKRENNAREQRIAAFLKENAAVRRYVLRELENRGPLLSREIEDHAATRREPHRWYGERKMALMLMILADRGEVAVVGRRLVYDRDRAEALWAFHYRLEIYVPAANREYGYYVLPILRGDRVIGRIEPVHDRKPGRLHVRGVWWEDGVRPVSLDRPLESLARWLGATIA
jgi:uncharacterized protein YcaQ